MIKKEIVSVGQYYTIFQESAGTLLFTNSHLFDIVMKAIHGSHWRCLTKAGNVQFNMQYHNGRVCYLHFYEQHC